MLKNPLLQPGRQVALHYRERLLALRERPPVQLVRGVPAHPGRPLVGPAVPRLLPVDDACHVLEHPHQRVDSGAQVLVPRRLGDLGRGLRPPIQLHAVQPHLVAEVVATRLTGASPVRRELAQADVRLVGLDPQLLRHGGGGARKAGGGGQRIDLPE
eukprot:7640449-Pyramimonas_sp.AAC.1